MQLNKIRTVDYL